jgi:hypothetical protein
VTISISPTTASALVGTSVRFSAVIGGSSNVAVAYSVVSGADAGRVTADGLYTASATPGTYRIRVTSVADPTKSAEAVVTVRDYEKTFSTVTGLADGYDYHTASLLDDGTVLVVGGFGYAGVHRQALLYDPAHQTFTSDAPLETPRIGHAAVTLDDGRVMAMGGYNPYVPGSGFDPVFTSTEIYDPSARKFTGGPKMNFPRRHHVVTRLRDGKWLLTGGIQLRGNGFGASANTEQYDPASNQFTPGTRMNQGRWLHTATLLNDGRVLIVGGRDNNCTGNCDVYSLRTAEIFDPSTGLFTPTADLHISRYGHTATLLPDGRVLILGGESTEVIEDGSDEVKTTEIYDPASGQFSLGPELILGRSSHTATWLNCGKILLAGGYRVSGFGTERTEIFDPSTGTSMEGPAMSEFHIRGTATKLPSGEVLIFAGSLGSRPTHVVERFR